MLGYTGACAANARTRPDSPIPASAGVGLKPAHYQHILEHRPAIGWFEVHPENYMGAGGPPHRYLEAIRERYPLSLHGVGLSIGGAHPLDREHLGRLAALVRRYQPALFSEHLAWSTHTRGFMNDLLPLPYNDETLAHVAGHIGEVQDALGRRMLVENPATYLRFEDSSIAETRSSRNWRRARAAACCSTSTTSMYRVPTTDSTPLPISTASRCALSRRSTSPGTSVARMTWASHC